MYEKAKAYYDAFGNLEIPKDYYTEDGYSLGIWIATQRAIFRGTYSNKSYTLTQVQIDKLTAIGMRWKRAADISWERFFESAKRYAEKHGDLLPNYQYVDEDGIRLGAWICNQRTARKNGISQYGLTEERIARLDEIGMVWDVPDYRWEEGYSAAVLYHKENGDLNVSQKYLDKNGFRLGAWVNSQRTARKTGTDALTEDRIARLDTLGIIWVDKAEKQWNDMFQALCDYNNEHHTLNVPIKIKAKNGQNLYLWISRQRELYKQGKLTAERTEKLKNIGFELDPPDLWEMNFQAAKAYFEENGDLNIPDDYKEAGGNLRGWLTRQKKYANKEGDSRLSDDKIEKLRSIGLFDEISHADKIWLQRYEMAKAYFLKHGDLRIPKDYAVDGFQLGIWVYFCEDDRKGA